MTKYNDLTQEQKESINPKLRKLFEGIENALAFPEVNMYCYQIEGFQEGLKTAIKIIDKEIEFLGGKINVEEIDNEPEEIPEIIEQNGRKYRLVEE